MKFVLCAALLFAAPAAYAQTTPAPTAPAAASKFNLDTPIEQLAADPAAKAVLDSDVPGLTTHEAFDMFKAMSLNQLAPMSQGKITDEVLAKLGTDLAKIK